MKLIVTSIFVMIVSAGLFINPVFVSASDTCYVDKDVDDDGDGSKSEPYKKISKALDEICNKIEVEKGTYDDDITIGKGVFVNGDDKDNVIIIGKVIMKDGSTIKNVTVSDSGIDIDYDADATIEDTKIKNARIGIETTGGGKLVVKDSVLYGNNKAMYLQKGKKVDIRNNDMYDNDEDGINIKANVDGTISNNSIHENGENGIVVIVGKTELNITNNKIKKNSASGIAVQFYKSVSKLEGVKIKDNTITGNKDYGINCKALSGGNPSADYWMKSIEMLANKVYSNKDGEFSESCHFNEAIEINAISTKKEVEVARAKREEESQLQQKALEDEKVAQKLEKDRLAKIEEQKKQEQEEFRNKLQNEKNLQRKAEMVVIEVESLYDNDTISKEKIKSRPKFFMFFIGPDVKELNKLKSSLLLYEEKGQSIVDLKNEINDEEILKDLDSMTAEINDKKEDIINTIKEYEGLFSLVGWAFKNR